MTEFEQKKLIREAKNGSSGAFGKLVKIHEKKLFSLALNFAEGDHSAACDILQEALIKAFKYIKNFKEKSSFITWLWPIVRNEMITYRKSKKTSSLFSIEHIKETKIATDETSLNSIIEKERKTQLRKLISKLPSKYSEVLTLIDFQELSYEETAKILGIKLEVVKIRIYRAREKLTKMVLKNEKLFL